MTSFSLASSSKHPRFDTIIGLDVAGTLYYCRKSTLLGMGDGTSYFAARFGPDSMMDPLRDQIDDHGREIYFIDRNPEVFKYILEYLRNHKLPPQIGSFQSNPELWRALRTEAEFYSLDGLVSLLKNTHTCSPDVDGGKGILHWLGTNRNTEHYINPYRRQAVDITGWFDTRYTHPPPPNTTTATSTLWGACDSKENFVQYRPTPDKAREPRSGDTTWQRYQYGVGNVCFRCLTDCRQSNQRLPVVLDLRKVLVAPTHYSLRYGACRGMDGRWNFEGSNDGVAWTILHAGSDTQHKLRATRISDQQAQFDAKWFDYFRLGPQSGLKDWDEVYCDYMERHYRHTWEIDFEPSSSPTSSPRSQPLPSQHLQLRQQQQQSPRYFRYFRIIGNDPRDGEGRCLHFIGLEIYGHVYEE